MMPAPAHVAVASPAFPALPADLVIAMRKRAKVAGAAVLIGRRLGDDAYIDVLETEGAPKTDGHTLFAVDGLTETITALLLAEGVRRGEVRLDEPVDELHDADFHPPARGSSPVTLADLATHRAGLATVPLREAAQPYAAVDRATFAKLVNAPPGTRAASEYAPSVLDYALLGTLLADRAGTSYAALARERLFVPLDMNDTVADTGSDQRVIRGRSIADAAAAPWRYGALEPAGGVRSSVYDLLQFAGAMFADDNGPLAADMRLAGTARAAAGDGSIGLAWRIDASGARWASGASFGSTSFIGVAPQQHAAVVILSNVGLAFGNASFDDIGLRVLGTLAAGKRGATP